MRIGYACINMTLAEEKIQVNRSMIKKTFQSRGIEYASELALKNVTDLSRIIDWNIKHKLFLYRMSSDMFPWMSEYELSGLPGIGQIKKVLFAIGEKVKQNNMRLSFHPGPFNVLASLSEKVVMNTFKALKQHGEIMDMIGLPRSPFSKINIHVGGAYGDKEAALQRFAANLELLPPTVRQRLTVENDDKGNMFSIKDLYKLHELSGIPLVFDYLHHQFCTGNLSEEAALSLALSTWPDEIPPVIHFSSSRKHYEDPASTATSHADYIYQKVKSYGRDFDIMLEAKAKEKAGLKYMKEFGISL